MIRAVVFDIGQTLVYYPMPLNWSKLYKPAFGNVAEVLGLSISEEEYVHIGEVLTRYNTRINPRETEVSSDRIFTEILEGTSIPMELMQRVKELFYDYFRRDTVVYPEAEKTLIELRSRGILTATLSDVAYGMDNKFALGDIAALLRYIDLPCTSNDTGFRKPCREALETVAEKLGVGNDEMIFVGDELKDMQCAKNAGAFGVLIDRDDEEKAYGQNATISSLEGVLELLR